ncbi:hypothetical protein [Streptomyces sp. NPDC001070]
MTDTFPRGPAGPDGPPDDPARSGGEPAVPADGTAPADGAMCDGAGGTVWLIGLRHRAGSGALVRHYYVVADTARGVEALRRAHRCAARPTEYRLRDGAAIDGTWAEVRRLRRDALGRFLLADRAL